MQTGKQEWYDENPYESFMRRHLQHYGYYTGKNEGYRHHLAAFDDWDKTHGYDVSSDSDDSEYENEALRDKDDKDGKSPDDLRTTQLTFSCQAGRMVPRLKEPRQLYALNKEIGPQQAARWPVEIQVLKERVKYIPYVPKEPEVLYSKTGTETAPLVKGEEGGGRVVFHYQPAGGPFFIRSRVGGHRSGPLEAAVRLDSEADTTLIFESRYESGNLAKAVQVGEYEYELWLRTDLYTNKHTQWFNFRVSNTKANRKYRFSLVNFMKSDSLYNCGMRPLMYSEKNAAGKKIGWIRFGSSIKYHRNNLKYSTNKGDKSYYSLTFTCEFPHDNDTVYIAHCYPYTYTDLQDYILDIMNDPVKSKICKQRVLCRTLAGNMVYVLTITSPSKGPEEIKHKKAVVITARVHPGETNASWMMKGFLDYLTGQSADAKLLRDTFIFKIVPMLNPDGVIVGNYRCSLAGRDLNRNYKTVLKESFPSVWHTKNMIKRLLDEREVIVYCDLHGHSRKHNVFIYGCENRHNPDRRLRERVFPVMLSRNASDKFSYEGCKFKVQKSKEGTGRIVMWNLGIMNSYTMEATFAGSSLGKKRGYHFNTADFESMGFHFCDSLLDYCDPDGTKSANIVCELEERVKLEIMARLEKQGQEVTLDDVDLSDADSDAGSSDSGGSDSSVSDGLPVHLQFMSAKFEPKKKKRYKTKKQLDSQRKDHKSNMTPSETATEKPNQRSPSHQQCKTQVIPKPVGAPSIRYAAGAGSGKRPRSKAEDKEQRSGSGLPVYVKERMEERENRKTEYLEAITNAMKNGLFSPTEGPSASEVPHFRYSLTSKAMPTFPMNLENLCSHHEQAFAAHYVVNQLNQPHRDDTASYTFTKSGQESPSTSLQSQSYAKKNTLEPFTDMTERPASRDNPATRSLREVMIPKESSMYIVKESSGLPYVELLRNTIPDDEDKGIPRYRFVNRRNSAKTPSDQRLNLEVKPSQRHLLELAVAHQRQQEYLQMEFRRQNGTESRLGSAVRQHPPPFDDKLERDKPYDYVRRGHSAKSGSRPRVPSATPTYTVFPSPSGTSFKDSESLTNLNNNNLIIGGAKTRSQGDMRALDTDEDTPPGINEDEDLLLRKLSLVSSSDQQEMYRPSSAVVPEQRTKTPRHPSPKKKGRKKHGNKSRLGKSHDTGSSTTIHDGNQTEKSSKDISHTINSIQKLKQSVIDSANRANLSPTTGQYIADNVREIDEEVNSIAAQLESNEPKSQGKANESEDRDRDRVSDKLSSNSSASRHSDRKIPPDRGNIRQEEQEYSEIWNVKDNRGRNEIVDNYSNGHVLPHQIEPMRIVANNKGQVRFENAKNRPVDRNSNELRAKQLNGTAKILKSRVRDSPEDNQSIWSKSSSYVGDFENVAEEDRRVWNNSRAEQGQGTWDDDVDPHWPNDRRDSTSSYSDRDGRGVLDQRQAESAQRQVRARSSKGMRTPQELTSPTKISLMITQGHRDLYKRSKFLPLTRSRPPLLRIPPKKR